MEDNRFTQGIPEKRRGKDESFKFGAVSDLNSGESRRTKASVSAKAGTAKSRDAQKKKDGFDTVTVVQMVLAALIAISVFVMIKTGAGQALRADFNSLMQWESFKSDAASVMAYVKDYLSQPVQFFPAFSPSQEETDASSDADESTDKDGTTEVDTSVKSDVADESQTQENTAQETAGDSASDDSEQENSDKETENENTEEAESSETEESVALQEPVTERAASGGEDILELKAQANTTFSPTATTTPILSPVDSKNYTSLFGYRINPITNVESFHTGLDIAAPLGTKIRAAYSGTVSKTGEDSHSGKYIFLEHSDGYETFYCHCSEILAEKGANIRQGETIALVGSTGWSTGPHLHFEIHKDGTRLDPLAILQQYDS